MTIPILPGPFSFLAPVGGAIGGASEAKEKKRVTDVAEARQAAMQALEMRKNGFLPPEAFARPEMQRIFQVAGYDLPSATPTPEEQKSALTGQYLTALGQPPVSIPFLGMGGAPTGVTTEVNPVDRFTPEQRQVIGAPAKSAIGIEKAKASAISGGGAQARSVTGVPSQQVATAAESEKVSAAFKQEAPGFVALATRGVKLSSVSPAEFDAYVNSAFQAYMDDARANNQSVLPERQAKRYFADALQQAINKQQELDSQRIGAISRGRASQDRELPDINVEVDNLKQQKDQVQAARDKLVASIGGEFVLSAARNNTAMSALLAESLKRIDDYDAQLAGFDHKIADAQQRYHEGLGARYPERPSGESSESLRRRQAQWDEAYRRVRAGEQSKNAPRQPGETPEQYVTRIMGGPRP